MSTNFSLRIPAWNIDWYKPQTTFWQDFWIASVYGADTVKEAYKRAFRAYNAKYIHMTELALVLNHMGWCIHQENPNLARVFFDLWDQHIDWCKENFEGDAQEFFERMHRN